MTDVWDQYLFHYVSEGGLTFLVMALVVGCPLLSSPIYSGGSVILIKMSSVN
jgi:hypothetical protein